MIPIFIGYDPRESVAYHTCVNSIIRNSSVPVSFTPLALNNLNEYQETHTDGSNHFIYSRFLVPHLMNYDGWAIFMDGDMIVLDDILNLWDKRNESKAVMVVKHEYTTKSEVKYFNSKNENYPRKNWSSVILWNCSHPSNAVVTPKLVEESPGSYLHRFSWLKDNEIGELPIDWNWLPDEFGFYKNAKLLHYTLGTPCIHQYATTTMADLWHKEKQLMEYSLQYE